jgi:GNAT superfamily N-acetyltransferase
MNIIIKPLTPELKTDYFDFFENRAFTDDSPYRCYCQAYQMSKEQHQAAYDNIDVAEIGRASRNIAEQQIDSGVLHGYLAYVDGISIGWCNANDRANYPAEPQFDVPFYAPAENREKGVATALVQRVVDDAKADGYLAVVGFPVARDKRYEWDFLGPIRLYEKAGFVEVARREDKIVMRKTLHKE